MTQIPHIPLARDNGRYALVEARATDAFKLSGMFRQIRNQKARELGANGFGLTTVALDGIVTRGIENFTAQMDADKERQMRKWEKTMRGPAAESCGLIIAGGMGMDRLMPVVFAAVVPLVRHFRKPVDANKGFFGYHFYTLQDTHTGEVVGFTSLENGPDNEAELTYYIRPDHHRKGLGRDMAKTMVAHGVQQMGFDKVKLVVKPHNAESQELAKRLGASYQHTATAPDRRGKRDIYTVSADTLIAS